MTAQSAGSLGIERIEVIAKAVPREGQTVAELARWLEENDYDVLSLDETGVVISRTQTDAQVD